MKAMNAPARDIDQFIFSWLPHPVLVIDPDGRVESANHAAESFFETSAARLEQKGLTAVLPFDSPLFAIIDQVRREGAVFGEHRIDIELPHLQRLHTVDIFAAPVGGANAQVGLMLLQRTMAEKIDRQLSHRGAARSITGLASILAHEIKNPLSGIRGAAQLLESTGTPEDRILTRLICDEADRIVGLVNRMDVFADERPADLQPVNIHVVLQRVKTLAETGFASGMRIIERYDPSLPPVLGNMDQLVQIFLNLVKNAAEALSEVEHPEITLSTAFRPGIRYVLPEGNRRVALPLEFAVTDNGTGVPRDIRPYLFDPFVTTKANGTGLGLALVSKIVRDHGGVIECQSKPGRTTFRILMPAHSTKPGERPRRVRA